jgi:Holliday junction resolvase RusA-like endonuclease
MISFEVLGEAAPKGSMRAILIRGRAQLVSGASDVNRRKLRAWSKAVRAAVTALLGKRTHPLYVGTPLEVQLLFKLVRPGGHYGARGLLPSAPPHPATKPDIDKLARATLDALTTDADEGYAGLYDDDSRIAVLTIEKQWGDPSRQGVVITIRPLVAHTQGTLDLSRGCDDKATPMVPEC